MVLSERIIENDYVLPELKETHSIKRMLLKLRNPFRELLRLRLMPRRFGMQ